jgi:hypothetical protein
VVWLDALEGYRRNDQSRADTEKTKINLDVERIICDQVDVYD